MDPKTRARQLCLGDDAVHGCAEATLIALKHHFELADPSDPTEAMALNGGIAYSGGTCGAITGAALAVGRLAGLRYERSEAKITARTLIQGLMAEFSAEFETTRCAELTGFDLAAEHDAFMDSGIWETGCMAQIEFVLDRVAPLAGTIRAGGSLD